MIYRKYFLKKTNNWNVFERSYISIKGSCNQTEYIYEILLDCFKCIIYNTNLNISCETIIYSDKTNEILVFNKEKYFIWSNLSVRKNVFLSQNNDKHEIFSHCYWTKNKFPLRMVQSLHAECFYLASIVLRSF